MTGPAPAPSGPATPAAVQAWLGPMPETTEDLAVVCNAVNSLIAQWIGPAPETGHPAHVVQAAVMLAGRVLRRRNSPAGIETAGELGPVYVQRHDPDVAMLLGLGTYTRPRIG